LFKAVAIFQMLVFPNHVFI